MKYREYEYRCRRCNKVFAEEEGYPAEDVEWHISVIAIPDAYEEKMLKERCPNLSFDLVSHSHHQCKDGGIGIGDLAGCSKIFEVEEDL